MGPDFLTFSLALFLRFSILTPMLDLFLTAHAAFLQLCSVQWNRGEDISQDRLMKACLLPGPNMPPRPLTLCLSGVSTGEKPGLNEMG